MLRVAEGENVANGFQLSRMLLRRPGGRAAPGEMNKIERRTGHAFGCYVGCEGYFESFPLSVWPLARRGLRGTRCVQLSNLSVMRETIHHYIIQVEKVGLTALKTIVGGRSGQ